MKKLNNYINCIEIYQLCIILNEYLENFDHEPIADNACTLSKVIKNKVEHLKDNLAESF